MRRDSSRWCATWSRKVRKEVPFPLDSLRTVYPRWCTSTSCEPDKILFCRPDRLASSTDALFALISHGPCRSRTRVPRRPRLAFRLRLFPGPAPRIGAAPGARASRSPTRTRRESRIGSLDHDGLDDPQQRGMFLKRHPPGGKWRILTSLLPQAVAVSPDMRYSLVRPENSPASLLIVATERIAALSELLDSCLDTLASFLGYALLSTTYHDPLSSSFASPPRPIIPADYVTATTGTGLVHTAPAHGVEDWEAWRAYHVAQREDEEGASVGGPSSPPDTLCAVDAAGQLDGTMRAMGLDEDVVQRLIGKEVLGDGTAEVIRLLEERGRLLKEVEVEHKFPYDWRTKQPVIYRYVPEQRPLWAYPSSA